MKKVYTILATALLATLFSGQVIGQVTFFPNPSMTGSFSISPTATELQRTATIKIWGAGGNGANGPSSNSGGGGGAGGYYQSKEIVLPAGTYTYVVGIGGQLSGQNQNITKLVFPGTAGEIIVYSGANASNANAGSNASSSLSPTGYPNQQPSYSPTRYNGGNNIGGAGAIGYGGTYSTTNGLPGGNGNGTTGTDNGANGTSPGTGGGGGKKGGGVGGIGANGRIEIVWRTGNGVGVLPVTFGTIKAFEKGTGVQVDWTSYSEQNLANYQVERSADGINFTSIGEVAPRNVTEATNYNFFDALPLSGTSFYRIRNNDIDGKSGLSTIVKVNLNKNIKTISVYPNPVRGNRVSFQTSDLAKGLYNVEVYNTMGSRVFSQALNHAGGAITQTLSLPTLQSGSYTLRINGTSSSSIHKITILQ